MEANRKKKKRNRHLSHRLAGVTGTLAVIAAVGLCMAFEFGVFRLLPVSSKEEEAVSQELLGQGSFYAEQIEDSGRRKQETLPEGNRAEEKRQVYLTFDDGPSKNTDRILDILKEYDVKATFFMLGKMIEADMALAKRVYDEGHLLANHSYSHNYQTLYASGESFMGEIQKTEELIEQVTGQKPFKLMRFPGGGYNAGDHAAEKQTYKELLRQNGYYYADWNALNGDAEGGNRTAAQLLAKIQATATQDRIVVLMHDAAAKK